MVLHMSRKERDRLKIIEQVDRGQMTQAHAGELLNLSERQIRRVLRQWRRQGDGGLVHGSRGRAAPNQIAPALREQAIARIGADYAGLGPSLVAEHLAADHGLVFSRETVRQWMIEERLWQARQQRGGHRRRRPRRECFGELVQMDTSIHDWLEGRGEQGVLILAIDDATSRPLMRFYPGDTTEANMDLIGRWIARHGRPKAFYVDWASHFRQHNRRGLHRGTRTRTQIERALGELQIGMINAHSPQAKGRVERSFRTLQDRLVKELRLRKVKTLAAANQFLEEVFIPWWEERLSVAPACTVDAHGSAAGLDLEAILCHQETRRVANDCTIQWGGERRQLVAEGEGRGLAGDRVTIEKRPDQTLRARWQGRYLGIEKFLRTNPQVAAAAAGEEAPVGLRPPCASSPAVKPPHHSKPSADHPWRRTLLLCRK
jgi:hypothetical protein